MSWGIVPPLVVLVVAVYFVTVTGWGRVLRDNLADDQPMERPE